jgi:hypothetical protein
MPRRQLLCPPCAAELQRLVEHPEIKDAGEHARFVVGASRGPYVCDDCNSFIAPGARCAAATLFTRGQTLGAWEADYVVPEVEPGKGAT